MLYDNKDVGGGCNIIRHVVEFVGGGYDINRSYCMWVVDIRFGGHSIEYKDL